MQTELPSVNREQSKMELTFGGTIGTFSEAYTICEKHQFNLAVNDGALLVLIPYLSWKLKILVCLHEYNTTKVC